MNAADRPKISITQDVQNESRAIEQGLDNIQAAAKMGCSDVVVITPNWVNAQKPSPQQASVVGQESLRTIIRYVKAQKPKRIVVAAGSGSDETPRVMQAFGYDQIILDEQVDFIDLNHGPFTLRSIPHSCPKETPLHMLIEQMSVLISFTQLKMHEEATMSAAIKNIALSWPPSEVHGQPKKNTGIHEDLHGFIAAMAQTLRADISIVSASPAMVGTGPTEGAAKQTGLVVVGDEMVSTDVICAGLLGLRPQAVGYLYKLIRGGCGFAEPEQMEMTGVPLIEAEKIFSRSVYGSEVVLHKNPF